MSEYFGKGCPHLCGKWEDEQMYYDDSYKESAPVLVLCTREDNRNPEIEGNCNKKDCPLLAELAKEE